MRAGLAVMVLAACDAQVGASYAGQPVLRLHGTAAGFGPDDLADAAALRWNTQRGVELDAGPMEAIPLDSAPPASFSLLVLAAPPDDVYFGFDGEAPRIAEAALLLTHDDGVVGAAIDYVLVYVDGTIEPASLCAGYLGEPLAPGFHVRDTRATAELTPAQAALAARCGGGDACRQPRLYRLIAAPADLATALVFTPGTGRR